MTDTEHGYKSPLDIKPIPAKISEAIASIMAKTSGILIEKGETNKHANYNYASVDQIYEMTAKLLAEAKLVIIPVEIADVAIVAGADGKNWARFVIGFVLSLDDAQYFDPHMRETLFIRIDGPQTFSGAKSYAQKSFLRHLFKLATGEPDLDAAAPDNRDEPQRKPAKKAKDDTSRVLLVPQESSKLSEGILYKLKGMKKPLSPQDRSDFAERHGADIARLQPADADSVRKAYADACKGPVA